MFTTTWNKVTWCVRIVISSLSYTCRVDPSSLALCRSLEPGVSATSSRARTHVYDRLLGQNSFWYLRVIMMFIRLDLSLTFQTCYNLSFVEFVHQMGTVQIKGFNLNIILA